MPLDSDPRELERQLVTDAAWHTSNAERNRSLVHDQCIPTLWGAPRPAAALASTRGGHQLFVKMLNSRTLTIPHVLTYEALMRELERRSGERMAGTRVLQGTTQLNNDTPLANQGVEPGSNLVVWPRMKGGSGSEMDPRRWRALMQADGEGLATQVQASRTQIQHARTALVRYMEKSDTAGRPQLRYARQAMESSGEASSLCSAAHSRAQRLWEVTFRAGLEAHVTADDSRRASEHMGSMRGLNECLCGLQAVILRAMEGATLYYEYASSEYRALRYEAETIADNDARRWAAMDGRAPERCPPAGMWCKSNGAEPVTRHTHSAVLVWGFEWVAGLGQAAQWAADGPHPEASGRHAHALRTKAVQVAARYAKAATEVTELLAEAVAAARAHVNGEQYTCEHITVRLRRHSTGSTAKPKGGAKEACAFTTTCGRRRALTLQLPRGGPIARRILRQMQVMWKGARSHAQVAADLHAEAVAKMTKEADASRKDAAHTARERTAAHGAAHEGEMRAHRAKAARGAGNPARTAGDGDVPPVAAQYLAESAKGEALFRVGDPARVCGLTSAAGLAMNGSMVTIRGYDEETERIIVAHQCGGGDTRRSLKRLKSTNLICYSEQNAGCAPTMTPGSPGKERLPPPTPSLLPRRRPMSADAGDSQ